MTMEVSYRNIKGILRDFFIKNNLNLELLFAFFNFLTGNSEKEKVQCRSSHLSFLLSRSCDDQMLE